VVQFFQKFACLCAFASWLGGLTGILNSSRVFLFLLSIELSGRQFGPSTRIQVRFCRSNFQLHWWCSRCCLGVPNNQPTGCIWNCVAVLDGYHLQIQTPSKTEAKNVKSFFSGHYQTYGINIQAACDHNCRFLFVGVAGPGVMGDRKAINQVPLGRLVEELPGL
jgi:hypothetical protein